MRDLRLTRRTVLGGLGLLAAAPGYTADALAGADQAQRKRLAGRRLIVGFRGMRVDSRSQIARDIREFQLGGVILFDLDMTTRQPRNVESPAQVKRLCRDLRSIAADAGCPEFHVAVDCEGGRINRFKPKYGFPDIPSHAELGRGEPEFTRAVATRLGETLAELGVSLNFAPCLDVNVNPDNPVIGRLERSFGSDSELVALHGAAFLEGLQAGGQVTGCAKHFPGHGSSREDSHLGWTDVTATWRETELTPYRRLIATGALKAVMPAHVFNANLDPDRPASLSRKIVQGLLREKLGFRGLVISDDMQMKAVTARFGLETALRLGLEAGVDRFVIGNNLEWDEGLARRAVEALTM